jgi:hypothetical protein
MEQTECECGCGTIINKYHKYKLVRFVSGHQRIGKKLSEEQRLKMSKKAKELGLLPPWIKERKNNSFRKTIEFKIWAEKVLLKNNGLCVVCGKKANQPHHVKDFFKFPKLRYDTDNGIPLCKACHLKIHNPLQYRWGEKKDKKMMYNA